MERDATTRENEPDPTGAPASPDRRALLRGGAALAAGGGLVGGASPAAARDGQRTDLYMPEEHWRDRMRAPDDGKRYGWVVDTRRGFGCHACEVGTSSS